MVQYMSEEQVRMRNGVEFFLQWREGLEELLSASPRSDKDEVWVSAADPGAVAVRDGVVLGVRVVVTYVVPAGHCWLWRDAWQDFQEVGRGR